MFNCVILEGCLTKDPESLNLKGNADPNRKGYKFTIAHDYKKGTTLFFDCLYFGDTAIMQYIKKGSSVIVQGKVEYTDWYDSQAQRKRSYTILIDSLNFSMYRCGNNKSAEEGLREKGINIIYTKQPQTQGQNYQGQNSNNDDGNFIPF